MKKEDIFDGVTNIRDDLIDEAAKKRKRPAAWRGAVAAVLALAIAAGGVALWRGRPTEPNEAPGGQTPGSSGGQTSGDPGGSAGGENPRFRDRGPDPGRGPIPGADTVSHGRVHRRLRPVVRRQEGAEADRGRA